MQPSHRQYSWVPSKIGNCCLSINFWRSLEEKPKRVAVAFEIEEKLGAVVVFPLAGVDRPAAQADDDGQMFDADGALEFAGSAGGALESGFLGDELA